MRLFSPVLMIVLTAFMLISLEVRAQTPAACAANSSDTACLCQGEAVDEAQYFPEVREQAIAVRSMLCLQTGDRSKIYQAFTEFAYSQHGNWFSRYGGFQDDADPLDPVLAALMTSSEEKFSVANMSPVFNNGIATDKNYFAAQPELCPESDCTAVFSEFIYYYNYAHNTLASAGASRFVNAVAGLSSQWGSYLSQSRSQTPLELWINRRFFRPNNDQQFFAPPDKQFIFLHPSLMIENVSDAVDGEETIEALMIEIVGIDRWRKSDWYKPSGYSIIAAYSDRPGVDDIGFGLAIHFRSLYTIGYTNHDGADGLLFSFDLLKLVVDKRTTFEAMSQ